MRLVCLAIICMLLTGYISLFPAQLVATTPDQEVNDTLKVTELCELAAALRDTDTRSALIHAKRAKVLADSLNDTRSIALVDETLGNIYYRLGDYSLAFEHSDKALKAYRSFWDQNGISRTVISIGTIYFEKKQYDVGVEYFKEGGGYRNPKGR